MMSRVPPGPGWAEQHRELHAGSFAPNGLGLVVSAAAYLWLQVETWGLGFHSRTVGAVWPCS